MQADLVARPRVPRHTLAGRGVRQTEPKCRRAVKLNSIRERSTVRSGPGARVPIVNDSLPSASLAREMAVVIGGSSAVLLIGNAVTSSSTPSFLMSLDQGLLDAAPRQQAGWHAAGRAVAWASAHLSQQQMLEVAGKLMSDGPIYTGLAGWLLCTALVLRGPDAWRSASHTLIPAALMYGLGGGALRHQDTALVWNLKEAYHRLRPDALHYDTFSFPSGHSTAVVFIWGALLYLLLPLALQQLQLQANAEARNRSGAAATDSGSEDGEASDQRASAARPKETSGPADVRNVAAEIVAYAAQLPLPLLWAAFSLTTISGRVLAEAHWVSDTIAGTCLGLSLTSLLILVSSSLRSSPFLARRDP